MANPFEEMNQQLLTIVRLLESLTKVMPSGPNNSEEEEVGIDQAATITGLEESTIRNYASKRSIPCSKVGGRLRFQRVQLIAWQEMRTNKRNTL